MDFGNLKSMEVKGSSTAPFTFYQIEGEPVLHVSPATEANKPYFNELLKRNTNRRVQAALRSGKFTTSMIEENRKNDRKLFPQLVIRGWEKVKDSTGEEAEFNLENVTAFIQALPDWLFDELRNFAGEPLNFVETLLDSEETSGNLQEG